MKINNNSDRCGTRGIRRRRRRQFWKQH